MLDDPVAFRSFVERQLELPLAEWAGKTMKSLLRRQLKLPLIEN
jgi:hypothetical protein